jgi:hypothetical protein
LRRPKVEPAGLRQKPGRLLRVVAGLGHRAVYSWKVQVPQTFLLVR